MIVVGLEHLTTGERKLDKALSRWLKVAEGATWKNLVEVRQTFPDTDPVKGSTVFDILHNRYRLMTTIAYAFKTVRVWGVLTHAEYMRWSRE